MAAVLNIAGYSALILIRNLLLTIVIELAAAAIIRIPLKAQGNWRRLILINVLTNVPASLILLVFSSQVLPLFPGMARGNLTLFYVAVQFILEVLIVLTEGWLIRRWIKESPARPLPASLAMNVSSYLIGVIIGLYFG